MFSRPSGRSRRRFLLLLALAAFVLLPYGYQMRKPLPEGLDFAGPRQPVENAIFLRDLSYVDSTGQRHSDQQIFDAMLDIVGNARRFVVLDMFLYNPYLGTAADPARRLSAELTDALIARKREIPALEIIVITDPINTVYGGMDSGQFERLREQDIAVVTTELERLRDSNPVYSLVWRLLIRPFGNGEGSLLPNPFGEGRVSLRSYLGMLNFKANHRKTLLADSDTGLVALVSSANPHDGSSAHTNIAIRFDGPAVLDLLATENAVLAFSGHAAVSPPIAMPPPAAADASAASPASAASAASAGDPAAGLSLQLLTENRIKRAVLEAIADAGPGDQLSLAMFYLSDRDIIRAIKSAQQRGVATRVLLDPNKDAFGRTKNGVPARPVARELNAAGVPVRWCDTHGEQCHMKMLLVDYADASSTLIAGSANFTRRNLDNFNLETDVALRGPREAVALADARAFFELMWRNEPERRISTDYPAYADESRWKRLLYRFMESSGISTF